MSKICELLRTEENIEYHEDARPVEDSGTGDEFYDNAVQCMLSLYAERFALINQKSTRELQTLTIWKEIAKSMRESFFYFDGNQIRLKFSTLRKQYFDIKSIQDIEDFEYFEYFHQIYNDDYIAMILNGGELKVCERRTYHDEVLMAIEQSQCPDISQIVQKVTTNGINMNENCLRNMDNSNRHEFTSLNQQNDAGGTNCIRPRNKRTNCEETYSPDNGKPPLKSRKLLSPTSSTGKHFTAFDLNLEQEKRHREVMQLMHESIKLQERSIDLQQQILQALRAHI